MMLVDILTRVRRFYAYKTVDTLFNEKVFPYAVEYGYVGTEGVLRLHTLSNGEISPSIEKDYAAEVEGNPEKRYFIGISEQGQLLPLSAFPPSAFGLTTNKEKEALLKAVSEHFPAIEKLEIQLSPVLFNRPEPDYWKYIAKHTGEKWWVLYAYGVDGSVHIFTQYAEGDTVIFPSAALTGLKDFYMLGHFPTNPKAYGIKIFTRKIPNGEEEPSFQDWLFFSYGNKAYGMDVSNVHSGEIPYEARVYSSTDKPFEMKVYAGESGDILVLPGSLQIYTLDGGEETIEGNFTGVYSIDINANAKVDYIYATTADGKILRVNAKDFSVNTLLEGAEPFSLPPTVSGGPEGQPWVFAVSGNYQTGVSGKLYGIKEIFSTEPVEADSIPEGRGWVEALPSGYFPMPWANIEVFFGTLYVPLVRENSSVPYCSLCVNARTYAYPISGGGPSAVYEKTLSPKLSLKPTGGQGFNQSVKGMLYSAGVRNIKIIRSSNIPAPEKLWKHVGTVYRRTNKKH